MVEVKADALEQSFDAIEEEEDGVAALKAELELLKSKIASGAIAAQRAHLDVIGLDGVKSDEARSFVDQYIRRGIEAGLETKAIGNSSDSIGGYAVPKQIDEVIDETLCRLWIVDPGSDRTAGHLLRRRSVRGRRSARDCRRAGRQ